MVKLNNDFYFEENNINIFSFKNKKKQIVLLNTGCSINDFLTKITHRYNGKYTKIPTFTIDRKGQIYQHYNPLYSSKILDKQEFNKQAITISLENVGWINNIKLNNKFTDWCGNLYENEIIEKPWRNKTYWASYTDDQFNGLCELINYLCVEYSINKNFIGNNVITHKPLIFKGILNRSNFSKDHYDLTPAFNFDKLTEIINNKI